MPTVRIKANEPFERCLRRFKRLCERADIINRFKSKTFYDKPTWVRKRAKDAAMKRNYYLMRQYAV